MVLVSHGVTPCERPLMKAAQYIAMTASVDGQLRFAIAGKRLLEVNYKGSVRLVEPHDYGRQKGKDRVLVFQRRVIRGVPGSKPFGWRMFEVPLIEQCVVTEGTFTGSRGRSDQNHYVWDVLYARVE
jgi:hypothetical protein